MIGISGTHTTVSSNIKYCALLQSFLSMPWTTVLSKSAMYWRSGHNSSLCVCVPCVGTPEGWEKALDSLEPELQAVCVPNMNAGAKSRSSAMAQCTHYCHTSAPALGFLSIPHSRLSPRWPLFRWEWFRFPTNEWEHVVFIFPCLGYLT